MADSGDSEAHDVLLASLLTGRGAHQASVQWVVDPRKPSGGAHFFAEAALATPGRLLNETHCVAVPAAAEANAKAVALVLPVDRVPSRAAEPLNILHRRARGEYFLLVAIYGRGRRGLLRDELVLRAGADGAIERVENPPAFPWAGFADPLALAFALPDERPRPSGSRGRPRPGRSELSAFCARELPAWTAAVNAIDGYLRRCTGCEQAMLLAWLQLRAALADLRASGRATAVLDHWREHSYLYQPDERELSTCIAAVIVGCEGDEETPNLAALRSGLGLVVAEAERQHFDEAQRWDMSVTEALRGDDVHLMQEGDLDALMTLHRPFRDLLYLYECDKRGELLLNRAHSAPLPADPAETLALLLRTIPHRAVLVGDPPLARYFPTRADRLLSLDPTRQERIAADATEHDDELARQLGREIVLHRRYLLDHVAIVDVDEFGFRRLILTPEERFESYEFLVSFLAEHRLGSFLGEAHIVLAVGEDNEPNEGSHVGADVSVYGFASDEVADRVRAALLLLVLAVWRDLVAPGVRDEQYERKVVRSTKRASKRKARAQRKGDVEVVRYLPRRLAIRRAEEQERKERGAPTLRRLYWVGAHARRLRDGEHRSYEADEYAREIGIPLQPSQTVVQPHPRGGTPEEREQARADPPELVRHWRSWSALDLLRTRSRAETPVSAS